MSRWWKSLILIWMKYGTKFVVFCYLYPRYQLFYLSNYFESFSGAIKSTFFEITQTFGGHSAQSFYSPWFRCGVKGMSSFIGNQRRFYSHVAGWICSVWFCGSGLIFFIARVIGGNVSYSQCLGVIGYSILPLSVGKYQWYCIIVLMTGAISGCILMNLTSSIYGMDTIFWFVGIIWAAYSSSSLLISEEYHEKKPLLLYPILLLFIYFMHLHTGV